MKRFVLAGLMITTLSTALGATLVYGDRGAAVNSDSQRQVHSTALPTPEEIAAWKATATVTDYIAPKAPL